MKHIALLSLSLLLSTSLATAQDIFCMADFAAQDLSGTARYVGMGGAMSALGADMSTMSTNPAGTALYRKSDVAVTASVVSQNDGHKYDGKGTTHGSFDQIGLVYVTQIGHRSSRFFNFGFNYHKQKDFNRLINTSHDYNATDGPSQTWALADLASYWGSPLAATPLTYMGYCGYLLGDDLSCYNAGSHHYDQAQWGSIQAYDFNLSTNLDDRLYFGLTLGVLNVDYNSTSLYGESLYTADGTYDGLYNLTNDIDISGYGLNFRFGAIIRPIADSPFRFGLSISTPTYYDLKYRSNAYLKSSLGADESETYNQSTQTRYDYNIHTPWTFNLSLGHTLNFGRQSALAIGAEYEYADYSTCEQSYGDGWDDGWDDWYDEDVELNHQADHWLKSVHTFRLGVEFMPIPQLAIRAGYNHITSPVDQDAYANQFIDSRTIDYSTSTAYYLPSATNRFTFGLGFNCEGFYFDATCKIQSQHADFYAFNTQAGNDHAVNECPRKRINLGNTQVLFTLGYRF